MEMTKMYRKFHPPCWEVYGQPEHVPPSNYLPVLPEVAAWREELAAQEQTGMRMPNSPMSLCRPPFPTSKVITATKAS